MSSAFTDPQALTTSAYADPTKLAARTAIYAYQSPRINLVSEIVKRARDVDGPILDVGCGPGHYARALRAAVPARPVVACDLSPGMVAVAGPPAAVATAASLPFRDRAFAGSLALHMLYHLASPDLALAELARVTTGPVLISTNHLVHRREMHELHAAAAADVGVMSIDPEGLASRFSLDEAEAAARRHFRGVDRTDIIGTVAVPEAAPVVAFIASTASWYGDPATYAPVLDRVAVRVNEIIARDGAFRFRTHVGLLACR
jgi:SAM-dependent methyltransferase